MEKLNRKKDDEIEKLNETLKEKEITIESECKKTNNSENTNNIDFNKLHLE